MVNVLDVFIIINIWPCMSLVWISKISIINAFTPSYCCVLLLACLLAHPFFTLHQHFTAYHDKDISNKLSTCITGTTECSCMHHLMTKEESTCSCEHADTFWKRSILFCHGMLLPDLQQVCQSEQITDK
jgi:hypothetical protein